MTRRRDETGFQGPTNGDTARTYGALYTIITHPAFRLGFLDALHGRPLDHDKIRERVITDTPPRAFERMNFDPFAMSFELAQYRYEEGRIAVIQEGLRCKAWGHPDFPPAALRKYIWGRADKTPRAQPETASPSMVVQMRCGGLPLFSQFGGGA